MQRCSLTDVSVLLNDGAGDREPEMRFVVETRPQAIHVVGDLRDSGVVNLVGANAEKAGTIAMIRNDGKAILPRDILRGWKKPIGLVLGDIDDDRLLD